MTDAAGTAGKSRCVSAAARSSKALPGYCLPWRPAAGSGSGAVAGTCSAPCPLWPAGDPLVTSPERHKTGHMQLSRTLHAGSGHSQGSFKSLTD